jgi:hypothetical protein
MENSYCSTLSRASTPTVQLMLPASLRASEQDLQLEQL